MRLSLFSGMDKLKTLQTDLKTAQGALTALQDELPQFHALLTDNEGEVQRLKTNRAPLDDQAQARGRVAVAREMLEQHQSDIATAQAEVSRLERQLAREQRLEQMTAHAREADKHRTAVENTLAGAVENLHHACQTIIREWEAFETARTDFKTLGAEETGTGIWLSEPANIANRHLEAQVRGVLDALKERGVPLSGLLEEGATALRYRIDYNAGRPLPAEGLASLVWSAVLAHDTVPHSLKLVAPKLEQPVSVRYVDTLPKGRYRL